MIIENKVNYILKIKSKKIYTDIFILFSLLMAKANINEKDLNFNPQENKKFISLLDKIPSDKLKLLEKMELVNVLLDTGKFPKEIIAFNKAISVVKEYASAEIESIFSPEEKTTMLDICNKVTATIKILLTNTELSGFQNLLRAITPALQNETPERQKKFKSVLEGYYKTNNTKGIAKIKNLTTMYGTNNIYEILTQRIDYFSYHEKLPDEEMQKSDLDGTQIKEYYILKDKKWGDLLIKTGESIKKLYQDLEIDIPTAIEELKTQYHNIKIAQEADNESPMNEVFKSPDLLLAAQNEAKKILEKARERADDLVGEGVLKRLKELNEKLENNPDYSICLKEFMPKRNYINRLLEKNKKNEVPKYITIILEKLHKNKSSVSNAELLILYSYYVKNSYIPQHVIGGVIKNMRYLAQGKGIITNKLITAKIDPILQRENLTIAETIRILDFFPILFEETKKANQMNLDRLKITSGKRIHQILERVSTEAYDKTLSREEHSLVKNALKKWTFGTSTIEYKNDIIENNILKTEVISELQEKLKKFIIIDRKIDYYEGELVAPPKGEIMIKEERFPIKTLLWVFEKLVDDIKNTFSENRKNLDTVKKEVLPQAETLQKYGLAKNEDISKLYKKYDEIHNRENFSHITDGHTKNYINTLIARASMPFVKSISWITDIPALANYTYFHKDDIKLIQNMNATIGSLATDKNKKFWTPRHSLEDLANMANEVKEFDWTIMINGTSIWYESTDTFQFDAIWIRKRQGKLKNIELVCYDLEKIKRVYGKYLNPEKSAYTEVDKERILMMDQKLLNERNTRVMKSDPTLIRSETSAPGVQQGKILISTAYKEYLENIVESKNIFPEAKISENKNPWLS